MNRIKQALRNAKNKVSNCKQWIAAKVVSCKNWVVNTAKSVVRKIKHLVWGYPTTAEFVERWCEEIDKYCTSHNITPTEANFEVIKKDVSEPKYGIGTCIHYFIKAVVMAIVKYAKIAYPLLVIFLLFPFGGEEGLAQNIWESIVADEAKAKETAVNVLLVSGFIIYGILLIENFKSMYKEVAEQKKKKDALNMITFKLYGSIKANNFKF